MMQVAAEDTYDDYVICRGFDPRILRFIDYAEGDADKPGISVAKPFGKRTTGTYSIGEVYPALLPTQGNAGFSDFKQVVFTPPSPASVNWRVGQNPGVVTGGADGGQPSSLSDTIGILYDHNGKAINWLLLDSSGGTSSSCDTVRFMVVSSDPATRSALCEIRARPVGCGINDIPDTTLGGTVIEVCDPQGCYFNEPSSDLTGREGWAKYMLPITSNVCQVYPAAHWEVFALCCSTPDCEA